MRTIPVKQTLAVIIATIGIFSAVAHGQESHGRRIPPPEAFSACLGKADGATVSFTFRNETLSATCRMFEGKLAAAPDKNRNQMGSNGQISTQPPENNQR